MLFIQFLIRIIILECSIILLTLKKFKIKPSWFTLLGFKFANLFKAESVSRWLSPPWCGGWSWFLVVGGGDGKNYPHPPPQQVPKCQHCNSLGPGPGEVADFDKCVASKRTVLSALMENNMVYTFPFPVCRVSLRLG